MEGCVDRAQPRKHRYSGAAPGWRKSCSTTGNRFPMRKSATSPFSRRRGPALVSLAKQDRPVLHKCTTRYSRSSMTAVQHEDGGAGPIRRLHGRPSSRTRPGRHRRHGGGALLVRENTMIAVPRLAQRCVTSRGTLHSSRMKAPDGSNWTGRRATGTCHKRCGGVRGVCGVPVRLHAI